MWIELGRIAPQRLTDARRQAHDAAQWLARMARSYLPARDDDGHTALTWSNTRATSLDTAPGFHSAPHCRLAQPITADYEVVGRRLMAAYAPVVHKIFLGAEARPNNVIALENKTPAELEDMIPKILQSLGVNADRFSMALPYEPPQAPERTPDPDAIAELGAYYSNFAALLEDTTCAEPGAGPVRLWPHHFDLARLIAIDRAGGEEARSIGIGLAPDDALYDQPYLYITPWPRARVKATPEPPRGLRWHTEGYFGLVATAEELMLGLGGEQRTRDAIRDGVRLCRELLAD